MKRIAQNMAIGTLLYLLSPTQHVIIIDRKNMYDEGKVVFDAAKKDFIGYEYAKIEKSKIYKAEIAGDALKLYIETCNDIY